MPKIKIVRQYFFQPSIDIKPRNYPKKVIKIWELRGEYRFREPLLDMEDGKFLISTGQQMNFRMPVVRLSAGPYLTLELLQKDFKMPDMALVFHKDRAFYQDLQDKFSRVIGTDENGGPITVLDLIKKNALEDMSQSFLEQVAIQLTQEMEKLASPDFITYLDKFALEIITCLTFKSDGWSFLPVILFPSYAIATTSREFWFKWKSLMPGKEYIETNEVIDDDSIHIELCTEKDIQKYKWLNPYSEAAQTNREWLKTVDEVLQMAYSYKAFADMKKGLRFSLGLSCEDWPDVNLKFLFLEQMTDEDMKKAEALFGEFAEAWNNEMEKRGEGCIHYQGEAVKTGTKTCEMHVDFGSADAGVLDEVIQLYNKSDLPLKKLTFG